MKKIMFTLALLVQVMVAAASDKKEAIAQVRYDNVKMFQQASTSTTVLETLNKTDKIIFVRTFKYNRNWAIVTVNGKTGYVLQSELEALNKQS